MKNPPPCVFKKSCGLDFCMLEQCPEYKAKGRNQSYFGEDETQEKLLKPNWSQFK